LPTVHLFHDDSLQYLNRFSLSGNPKLSDNSSTPILSGQEQARDSKPCKSIPLHMSLVLGYAVWHQRQNMSGFSISSPRRLETAIQDHQDTFKVAVIFGPRNQDWASRQAKQCWWFDGRYGRRARAAGAASQALAQLYCSNRNNVLMPLQSRTLWKLGAGVASAAISTHAQALHALAETLSWSDFNVVPSIDGPLRSFLCPVRLRELSCINRM